MTRVSVRRWRRVGACLLAVWVLGALGVPLAADAGATSSAEHQLATRYAPVVRIVKQAVECGPGEPYQPTDVDAVLGNDTVALRGPWTTDDLLKIAPTGQDLAPGLPGYHLDLPGNPLKPACDYESWARMAAVGTRPTVYAHVVSQPGHSGVALQYWFYYPFNDYNNKHESDWEMIQLEFSAADAAGALEQAPLQVGFSQHEGVELADWDSAKVEKADGTHVVVHPAAGSHANYFSEALYLGRSSSQGFGCDNTLGPTTDLRTDVAVIPSDPAQARAAFPWISYEGHWGQRESAFYNGPKGPNTKTQWTEPFTWSRDEGRDTSFAVPAGGLFGTQATDFFCSAVGGGSDVVRAATDQPLAVIGLAVVVLALATLLVRRTVWRPTAPLRLARRRAWGQVLASGVRMYAHRPMLFLLIGVPTMPAAMVAAYVNQVATVAPSASGEPVLKGPSAWLSLAALGVTLLALVIALLAPAATTRAMTEIDAGRPVGVLRAYRLAVRRLPTQLAAVALLAVVAGGITRTPVLAPVALVIVLLCVLILPVVQLERLSWWRSLLRSAKLMVRRPGKVLFVVALGWALGAAIGPIVGTLLILADLVSFPAGNAISGVIYAVVVPLIAINTTYVYFDAAVRDALAPPRTTHVVLPEEVAPAEIT